MHDAVTCSGCGATEEIDAQSVAADENPLPEGWTEEHTASTDSPYEQTAFFCPDCSAAGAPEVKAPDVDRQAMYLTFDALERAACWAAAADEMEVAAGYVDTLLLYADQLEEWHTDYLDAGEDLAGVDADIQAQQVEVAEMLHDVRVWAAETGHPVLRWFDE